ncbi:hypothetical protein BJV78DRAFT_532883 [Lactifluus subvellereus]|nr:hypothetical protein BJV78DRAFT_532883 [Lactifluus subvellereus]
MPSAMHSSWKILARHARYFTSCIFYSLIFCLHCFYVYITFSYKQAEPPEDFIMSLRAETKTGYHHARHTVNLPIILVQTRWLSSGKSPFYASPIVVDTIILLFDQTTAREDVHIASAHGMRQSRPSGVHDSDNPSVAAVDHKPRRRPLVHMVRHVEYFNHLSCFVVSRTAIRS